MDQRNRNKRSDNNQTSDLGENCTRRKQRCMVLKGVINLKMDNVQSVMEDMFKNITEQYLPLRKGC